MSKLNILKNTLYLFLFVIMAALPVLAADSTVPVTAVYVGQDYAQHQDYSYTQTVYASMWNSDPDSDVVECQINWGDGAGWINVGVGTENVWYYTASHTYPQDDFGLKTISYRCKNNAVAGWSTSHPNTVPSDTITLQDVTEPATAIYLGQYNNGSHHDVSYNLTIYAYLWNLDSQSSISQCQIDWGNGWETVSKGSESAWYSTSYRYPDNDLGAKTVKYRCQNSVGTWSSGNEKHIDYDLITLQDVTPPVVAWYLGNSSYCPNASCPLVRANFSTNLTIYAALWNNDSQTFMSSCRIKWDTADSWQTVSIGTENTWYVVNHTYSTYGLKTIYYECNNTVGLVSSGNSVVNPPVDVDKILLINTTIPGVINCTNNSQCGLPSSSQSCNNLIFSLRNVTPTCFNAGTTSSYCANVTSFVNTTCDYICSNTSGCDYTECSDSADNDADTYIDYPLDLGCDNYFDDNESDGDINCTINADCGMDSNVTGCNGLNYFGSYTSYICNNPGTEHSYCTTNVGSFLVQCDYICSNSSGCDYTECSDSADNDADTYIDYPLDLGCINYYDDNESDGPINCTTNLNCGVSSLQTSCSGIIFSITNTTPTCFNAGTEHSYCANVTSISNNTCDYICSNTLGCDYTQCSDSADNDGDTYVDYPLDLGCTNYTDNNETDGPINCTTNLDCGAVSSSQTCSGLNFVVNTTTPTCINAGTEHSYCSYPVTQNTTVCSYICSGTLGCDYTQCSDSADNDGDTYVDYPLDLGCTNYTDNNETDGPINCTTNLDCGILSNIHYCSSLNFIVNTTTPTCNNAGTEHSYCSYPVIQNTSVCSHICSPTLGCDYTECSDSADNDGDTYVDYPLDLGCISYLDNNESNGPINCTTNLDCGAVSSSQSCSGLNFVVNTTTPTCINAGSEHSYCSYPITQNTTICSYICSGTFGCDYTECSDSADNDADTYIDYPLDLGCTNYTDNNESDGPINCTTNLDCGLVSNVSYCQGLIFETNITTPTCNNAGTEHSYCSNVISTVNTSCDYICSNTLGCDYTECSDSADNDGDTYVDYPVDLGCMSYLDNNESDGPINCTTNLDCGSAINISYCQDSLFITNFSTPTCMNAGTEQSYCTDVLSSTNNSCNYICSNSLGCDYTECSDSTDNDADQYVDYPLDLGCIDYYDDNESDGPINCTTNLDCGVATIDSSCNALIFSITNTTPTCFNAGSEHSYCENVTSSGMDICDYICSDSLGCDYTECSDSTDNDADQYVDYPLDLGCIDYYDDNESDGTINCTTNLDCGQATYESSCNDLFFSSLSAVPTCMNAGSEHSYCVNITETYNQTCNYICSATQGCDYTECSDSTDNDADQYIDYPFDLGCIDYYDNNESDGPINCSTNSDCGIVSNSTACLGMTFQANYTVPTCNNAGTEHSFCSIENVTLFAQCNHICNSCLGCDYTQCSDGVDNDADSFVDYPLDLGCYSYYDNNESDGQSNINCTTNLDCGNPFGTNYCDSLTFMRNTTTPTCVNAGTANSYCILQISSQSSYCSHICSDTYGCDYTQCSDGADNDGDSLVDYPLDSGCTSYADNNESNAVAINCTVDSDCGASSDVKYCDGLNFRRSIVTPICMNAGTENSYCSYNIGTSSVLCSHICSDTLGCDYTQCSDNADNDADGLIDYPYDLGCSNYLDNNETNSIINCTMDSDCGISSTTRECHDMHYMSSTTTYDCVNPGTEQSYCTVAMGMSHVVCNHICSNESGCDYTQCSDGVDNDADSFADYPLDIGCYNYYDNNESNAPAVTNVTASIIAVPSSGVVPLNVSFDANATGPGVLSYYWDFDASNGIQNDSTVKNLIVQYGTVGNYTVTLTVLSDNGLTGSATVTKVINVLPFTPEQILPREVYDKVDADALIERMSLSSEVLKEGQVLSISFEVRNRGDTDLEDVKLQVSIPEIGLSRKLAPFDVDKGQSKFKTISLVIPEDVQPGEYTLRATIISDGVKRVQHREIKIV